MSNQTLSIAVVLGLLATLGLAACSDGGSNSAAAKKEAAVKNEAAAASPSGAKGSGPASGADSGPAATKGASGGASEGSGEASKKDVSDDANGKEPAADAASGDAGNKAELMAVGKKTYDAICAACHQADGSGKPPMFPALAGSGVATGPIDAHIQQVLQGGGAMPPFGDQLSNQEIAGVVTFERNSFGNHTGDVVQPAQVEALR